MCFVGENDQQKLLIVALGKMMQADIFKEKHNDRNITLEEKATAQPMTK